MSSRKECNFAHSKLKQSDKNFLLCCSAHFSLPLLLLNLTLPFTVLPSFSSIFSSIFILLLCHAVGFSNLRPNPSEFRYHGRTNSTSRQRFLYKQKSCLFWIRRVCWMMFKCGIVVVASLAGYYFVLFITCHTISSTVVLIITRKQSR